MLKKFVTAVIALTMLGACAVTNTSTFTGQFQPPPEHSRVLVMTPNVELAILSAAGLPEPREDWSTAGRDNLATNIASFVQSENHQPSALDPSTAMEGRVGQIIRLHDAVGFSLMQRAALPTQKDRFEWTLGEGTRELAVAHEADYALFIGASGTYASAGRVAMMVGLAAVGIGVPLGSQVAYASLVELRTGNVIWFNTVLAAPGQDMRDPEGAQSLVQSLMKDVPL
jgi:hypothetical protein